MFGRSRGSALAKPKKLHSLEYLKYLYSVIQKNSVVNDQNCETVVEALRLTSEILIWGDQNDSTVMDFFLEKNVLEYFLKYVKQDPGRDVCVQLLQTLNILFENISNQTAIYYLLSNNHTNEIITHRFDFTDEEIVAYYISFLKTLSLRLNSNTIHFFYVESRREFDLYVEAIKLFCHPENMVRIAVRTITLNIHKVRDEGALEFIHHQTSLPYFSYLVWSIGNTILDIDGLLRSDLNAQARLRLDDLIAEHIDHLHYLNDLLSLGIEGINEVLCDHLLHRLFIPLHLYSLTKWYKPSAPKNIVSRPHVSHSVASFMLAHTFAILRHSDLIRVLAEAIFLGDPSLTDMHTVDNQDLSQQLDSSGSDDDRLHKSYSVADKLFTNLARDIHETVDTVENNPALEVASSLIISTSSIRAARSAPAGSRLSAYMEQVRKANRVLTFAQPGETLDAGLRKAQGVTPELLRSMWPPSLAPLKLCGSNGNENSAAAAVLPIPRVISKDEQSDSLSTASSESSDIDQVSPSGEIFLRKPGIFPVHSTPALFSEIPSNSHREDTAISKDGPGNDFVFGLRGRPFLRALYRAIEVGPGSDHDTLLGLLLLILIRANPGLDHDALRLTGLADPSTLTSLAPTTVDLSCIKDSCPAYDTALVGKLIEIISDSCKAASRVRLVTLQLAIRLLTEISCSTECGCQLSDEHFAQLVSAREEAMMVLRSYFQNDAIFLDLFEYELRSLQRGPVNLAKLVVDSSILLTTPSATVAPNPATPVASLSTSSHGARRDHGRHLPQSEVEHTQRAIGIYLFVHTWLESLLRTRPGEGRKPKEFAPRDKSSQPDSAQCSLFSEKLPLDLASLPGLSGLGDVPDSKSPASVHKAGDKLDLSAETLIGCTVERSGNHEKRFLVNYNQQLVLVEPDSKQIGWGVITFIGPLQDLEAACDPADSRCLHVTINAPGYLATSASSRGHSSHESAGLSKRVTPAPLLAARFLFEDHIRCMTARQLLIRGRELVRQTKLRKIATLLDFSPEFIRETFLSSGLSGAMNYGSASSFVSYTGQRNKAHSGAPRADALLNKPLLRVGEKSTSSSVAQSPNQNPSDFLQNRSKPHRARQERDAADGRIPLISLANLYMNSKRIPLNPESTANSSARADARNLTTTDTVTVNQLLAENRLPFGIPSPTFTLVPADATDNPTRNDSVSPSPSVTLHSPKPSQQAASVAGHSNADSRSSPK
ncbi:unnamed protein product [Calicophoron daubneyi]|uniref:CLEC16A n=1 Tax=Calicophoron daubneyi TaxID=300641 RepID=A0AAV2T036_CALDB